MKITLFIIILILIILLYESYRRNSAMTDDKEKAILTKDTTLEISRRVLNARDPAELYQFILESCLTLIPKAKYGSILMFTSEGLLAARAFVGFDSSQINNFSLKLEESFLYIATEGKLDRAVMVNRPEEIAPNNIIARSLPVKAEISAPLQLNGENFGILCVDGDQIDIFTEQDLHILEYMSNQISIVIKNQKLHDEIQYLSRFDSLSRLPNRHSLERETARLLNDPSKDTENLYFVVIDLDDLKTANSSLGHHIGDEIIQFFSETVRKYLGKNDFIGRYGGDEFVAVIQGNSLIVNQILEEAKKEFMDRKYDLGEKSYTPSFSYAKVSFKEGLSNLETLYRLSERKLYEMKTSKKK